MCKRWQYAGCWRPSIKDIATRSLSNAPKPVVGGKVEIAVLREASSRRETAEDVYLPTRGPHTFEEEGCLAFRLIYQFIGGTEPEYGRRRSLRVHTGRAEHSHYILHEDDQPEKKYRVYVFSRAV